MMSARTLLKAMNYRLVSIRPFMDSAAGVLCYDHTLRGRPFTFFEPMADQYGV